MAKAKIPKPPSLSACRGLTYLMETGCIKDNDEHCMNYQEKRDVDAAVRYLEKICDIHNLEKQNK